MAEFKDYLGLFKFPRMIHFVEVIIGFLIASGFAFTGLGNLLPVFVSLQLLIYPGIYAVNDLLDIKSDRMHPEKRKRAIASGAVSARDALIFVFVLTALGLALGFYISRILFVFELAFIGASLSYSLWLKHIPYVEFFSNALTHFLRVYLGIVLAGSKGFLSIAIVFFLVSTVFSVLKRENEIRKGHVKFRDTLKSYTANKINLVYFMLFSMILLIGINESGIQGNMILALGLISAIFILMFKLNLGVRSIFEFMK